MAALGEVPFRRYYGSVDSTPLFVMLAAQYFERTGDLETIRAIWPNIVAALGWIDNYGDMDGDGFVEYARQTDKGLSNQGWKDSSDSIFHRDGRLAVGADRLVRGAGLCLRGQEGRVGARRAAWATATCRPGCADEAETLRMRFEEAFWIEEAGHLCDRARWRQAAAAKCWRPTPVIACSPGSPRPNAPRRLPDC